MTKELTGYENLNPKHRRFVDEYLIHMSAAAAAKASGYKGANPKVHGCELYNTPAIRNVINQKIKEREAKAIITQEEVLRELIVVKNRCMEAEPAKDRNGNELGYFKFNAAGALKSLELLGKHLGMFGDKLNVTVKSHEDALLEIEKMGKA